MEAQKMIERKIIMEHKPNTSGKKFRSAMLIEEK